MIARVLLAKVPLCLLIGCAAFFGAILADPVVSTRVLFVVGGVFFVATGAASLNSLQERVLDGKMGRTKDRPLPSGQITTRQAGWQALILILGGLLLLVIKTGDALPAVMTAFAVILYNGIYTPLKKSSVLAIIPGAICGALPAYIGWLAGGGEGLGFTALLLFALFILWQIPHFWLILLNYQDEYVDGRLPNLLHQFRENTLKRLFITWIGALAFIMLMFATLSYPIANAARYGVVINALCLPGIFLLWLKLRKSNDYRLLFGALNCALFVHMLILGAGRMVGQQ
ncbi:MAG: UbiA family prenyltransferase [Proteobacteria bacterium]|nr:UbiA family prenyltransferase [Pseudomonadota bacterium]